MKKKVLDILARKNVKKFDVIIERDSVFPISFEQNELKILQNKNATGIGIRIFEEGRVGFSYTNDITTLSEAVDFARESSRYGKQLQLDLPSAPDYPSLSLYDDVFWDEKGWINKGREIIHKIESLSKDLKIDIDFVKAVSDVEIVNSEGFQGRYKKTTYGFTISGFAVLDYGFTFVMDIVSSTRLFQNIDASVDGILEKLAMARRVSKVKTGRIPVLFTPISLLPLVHSLSLGLDALNVKKGMSPLKDKIGEKIISEKITLIDNPYDYELTGARPFDGEGVITRISNIIEKGVLKAYLHNLETARHFGVEPTGTSQRGYNSLPKPGFNNMIIKNGERSLRDIIEDIDYGLLVDEVIGGGQSNILKGDYSMNVGLGFLIENGEVKGRVRNTMISGNFYEDLTNVTEISKESRKLLHIELPYILVDGVSVTSK